MTNIVLDTNIIITYPKLLGLKIPDIHFLVPIDVISELNSRASQRGKSYDDRVDLIERSAEQGIISIINTDLPIFRTYQNEIDSKKLSHVDVNIIATALSYSQKGEIAKIATFDNEIKKVAIAINIEVLTKDDIEQLISSFENPILKLTFQTRISEILLSIINAILSDIPLVGRFLVIKKLELPSIQGKIAFFEQKERINLIVGILIGIIVTILAFLIYNNLGRITSTINIWGTVCLIVILGILLFIFREKQRLSYGIFEFLIGVISIVLLFNSNDFDFAKIKFDLDFNVKLLGGLYIMVRGQDNIVKDLKDTKIGVRLKKYGIGT